MKLLGIDYGKKRIGIAISDENQKVAFPKVVLENDIRFFEKISKIVGEEGVETIILGESKNYKMQDNPIMPLINSLKERLEKELDVEVILHSEAMTSMQAEKMIGEKNKMVDASAAAIVLQSYLDSIKN